MNDRPLSKTARDKDSDREVIDATKRRMAALEEQRENLVARLRDSLERSGHSRKPAADTERVLTALEEVDEETRRAVASYLVELDRDE